MLSLLDINSGVCKASESSLDRVFEQVTRRNPVSRCQIVFDRDAFVRYCRHVFKRSYDPLMCNSASELNPGIH